MDYHFLKQAAALEEYRKGGSDVTWKKEPLTLAFWRAVAAEFVGTMLLVFLGTASTVNGLIPGMAPTVLSIALTFGLTVATLIQCFGHVSGTHINPAVTLGVVINKGVSVLKAIVYVIAQCLGAIAGSAILYGILPEKLREGLGANGKSEEITNVQAFFVELILTFILVTTVLGSTDPHRNSFGLVSLAIGLCVGVCHIVGIPLSGSSINPARSLGPPVITRDFPDYFWIYVAGPLAGGLIAALLYRFFFNPYCNKASLAEITPDAEETGTFRPITNGNGVIGSHKQYRNSGYEGEP